MVLEGTNKGSLSADKGNVVVLVTRQTICFVVSFGVFATKELQRTVVALLCHMLPQEGCMFAMVPPHLFHSITGIVV